MTKAVYSQLCGNQANCRQNSLCTDHITTLRTIIEQSLEWNSPLYVSFIDNEKASDSVDRETLWKLFGHYDIPKKSISMIQRSYQGISCRVVHGGHLSDNLYVNTGVLLPFLFTLVVHWIMRTSTEGRRNGRQWTLWSQLDDLDFADDLALLSHNHAQMQDKTTCLDSTSANIGLTSITARQRL